jgi:hypothetical protein
VGEMNTAIKSTPASLEIDRLTASIRQRPLRSLMISAGAGFLLGGGLRSRLGLALGLFVGRSFAGTAVVNAIQALADQNGRQYRPNQG